MVKNRFFKNTFGVAIEALVAQGLDTSNAESPAVGGTAGSATYSVTVAGTPTAGDQVILTLGNDEWHYEVGAGDTTAALFGTNILAYLNADPRSVALGLTWTKTGTTSLVLTATGPVGTALNGTAAGFRAGATNAGPTFSAFSSTNYAGGVNPIADQQPHFEAFVANAAAGKIGVYYEEHTAGSKANPAVKIGDTRLAANAARRIFWAVKDALGVVFRTSAFPLGPSLLRYDKAAYAAGTNQVSTLTVTARPAVGQTIHVRVTDTTLTQVPYPTYEYSAAVGGTAAAADVETALANIAAQINNNLEKIDPVVTASASSDNSMVLTLTGKNATISFKITTYNETTPAQPTDGYAATVAVTQQPVQPVGTIDDVTEFENYFKAMNTGVIYPPEGTLETEWNKFGSNVVAGTQYGYLVASQELELVQEGATRTYKQRKRVVIAIKNSDLNTLASF